MMGMFPVHLESANESASNKLVKYQQLEKEYDAVGKEFKEATDKWQAAYEEVNTLEGISVHAKSYSYLRDAAMKKRTTKMVGDTLRGNLIAILPGAYDTSFLLDDDDDDGAEMNQMAGCLRPPSVPSTPSCMRRAGSVDHGIFASECEPLLA